MANPVNNNPGLTAGIKVGGLLDVNLKIGGTPKVTDNQGTQIFGQVTENLGRNPNHAPGNPPPADNGAERAGNQDTAGDPPVVGDQNQDQAGEPTARPRVHGNQTDHPNEAGPTARDVPQNPKNKGQNGDLHAAGNGLENGQGHQKTGRQGTPPVVVDTDLPDHPNHTGNLNQPHNPRIQNEGRPAPVAGNPGEPKFDEPKMDVRFGLDLNIGGKGNGRGELVRTAVDQVLRHNDVFVDRRTLDTLLQPDSKNGFPPEVQKLVQTIRAAVVANLDNSAANRQLVHEISREVARQFDNSIQTVKTVVLKTPELNAATFRQLSNAARLTFAVEQMPPHLPAESVRDFLGFKAGQIVDGLLLARGFVVPPENSGDPRQMVFGRAAGWPPEMNSKNLRDLGQLVKVLIADTAAARTTADLDRAVQKFVRFLIANNELGVLLATARLAGQATNGAGTIGRALALAQIYELIDRLIALGEKTLAKNGSETEAAAKNSLREKNVSEVPVRVKDDEAKIAPLKDRHGAETVLRQFLEFNPASVHDRSASVFRDADDARHAQREFLNHHQTDIENWLRSGRHRFVRDYVFDKPLGIVVERNSAEVFTAGKVRFVLVRDGSVAGWHFLKSFLVR
ncbi:MAG: hypothetical protein JSS81_18315 [Acidobacteria bacterium]|nr:hypothetical protein [Acidobacteriota bacterium]